MSLINIAISYKCVCVAVSTHGHFAIVAVFLVKAWLSIRFRVHLHLYTWIIKFQCKINNHWHSLRMKLLVEGLVVP